MSSLSDQYARAVAREERDPSDALARASAVLTRLTAATAAIVAFLAGVAALTDRFDGATADIRLPLSGVLVFAAVLIGVAAVAVTYTCLENRQRWEAIAYWRG